MTRVVPQLRQGPAGAAVPVAVARFPARSCDENVVGKARPSFCVGGLVCKATEDGAACPHLSVVAEVVKQNLTCATDGRRQLVEIGISADEGSSGLAIKQAHGIGASTDDNERRTLEKREYDISVPRILAVHEAERGRVSCDLVKAVARCHAGGHSCPVDISPCGSPAWITTYSEQCAG